jgi:hypothetical protein
MPDDEVSMSDECYEIRNGDFPALGAQGFFVRSQTVVSRRVAGETVIVPVRGKVGDLASIYSFNETGSLIWNLLETPRTLREVADGLAQEFDVKRERAESDTAIFVNDMLLAGLVEVPKGTVGKGTQGPVGREGRAAAGAR